MAESTEANLTQTASTYRSRRGSWDVLLGDDAARPLIDASSTGDTKSLHILLSQPEWAKTALESQHSIYYARRQPGEEGIIKDVGALPMRHIERAVILASMHGHAAAVSALLDFVAGQGLDPASVITRWAAERALQGDHSDVIDILASAKPEIVTRANAYARKGPLELAVRQGKVGVIAVLLKHGAGSTSADGREVD